MLEWLKHWTIVLGFRFEFQFGQQSPSSVSMMWLWLPCHFDNSTIAGEGEGGTGDRFLFLTDMFETAFPGPVSQWELMQLPLLHPL